MASENNLSGLVVKGEPAHAPRHSRAMLWLYVVLFLFHAVVLVANFTLVPTTYGYDWPGHFTYLYYVAEHWQTPPADVSAQFFNPPLYYFSVAAFHRITGIPLARAGHVFNILLALGAFALLVALCRRFWRARPIPAAWLLGLYVLTPTVYRTFGMVRPEALLLFLFVVAMWLVAHFADVRPRWSLLAVGSGVIAGLAFGARQWGIFLEAALGLWMLVEGLRRATSSRDRWLALAYVFLQGAIFGIVAAVFMLVRGDNVLAFNTSMHGPDVRFLTCLSLPTLFSTPVRPALNNCFWPVLYADFWGDYWRYWREALWHDPSPTSPATLLALARSMWAALPATVVVALGVLCRAPSETKIAAPFHRFMRALVVVSLGGFLLFASLYADPNKGDTVKGVYIVYLTPCLGWCASVAAERFGRAFPRREWVVLLPLALIAVGVAPMGIYLPPERYLSRSWDRPDISHPLDVTLGNAITLVGYDAVFDASSGALELRLVWRADAYTGRSYKVFVHALDPQGALVAQSDAIPAQWQRPTYAWMLGEYIEDRHTLAISPEYLDDARVLVGLYDTQGNRLFTDSNVDHIQVDVLSALEIPER